MSVAPNSPSARAPRQRRAGDAAPAARSGSADAQERARLAGAERARGLEQRRGRRPRSRHAPGAGRTGRHERQRDDHAGGLEDEPDAGVVERAAEEPAAARARRAGRCPRPPAGRRAAARSASSSSARPRKRRVASSQAAGVPTRRIRASAIARRLEAEQQRVAAAVVVEAESRSPGATSVKIATIGRTRKPRVSASAARGHRAERACGASRRRPEPGLAQGRGAVALDEAVDEVLRVALVLRPAHDRRLVDDRRLQRARAAVIACSRPPAAGRR